MTKVPDFAALLAAANRRFPGEAIEIDGHRQAPVLHLYHAPNSICSQKVRAVLLHSGQPFISHSLDIFKGETYDPHYVRLRMRGCETSGLPLANTHPGTTSATSIGCDACVVPTIADEKAEEVMVNSKTICLRLDRQSEVAPGALMPDKIRSAIHAELSIVDNLPNYQLLAVAIGKPSRTAADNSFAISKVHRCNALLSEHSNDTTVCRAYIAKRAKEQAAADSLFEPEAMEHARARIELALRHLDAEFQRSKGPYLFGSIPTMADLFWGIEMIRISDLGLSQFNSDDDLPSLATYYRHVTELPSVARAVTHWPRARLNAMSH